MKKSSKSASKQGKNNYLIPNLDRALTVLEFLSEYGSSCGVTTVADELKIPKNSAFRILYTLTKRGYTEFDEKKKHYRVSGKLLALGHSVVDDSTMLEKAREPLNWLRHITGETSFIGMMVNHLGMVLDQYPSPRPVKFTITIGHQFDLYASAPGKIFAAFQPFEEMMHIVNEINFKPFNERTITNKEDFLKELTEVRVLGYAVDRGEEMESVHCIAAPVFDHKSRLAASVWITAPSFRVKHSQFSQIAVYVMKAASDISKELGYKSR